MTLYVAIGAMFAFMGAMVYVSTMDFEELEKGEIKLVGVEVTNVNSIENHFTLTGTLQIANHGERTFVIPIITYDHFVNGEFIGNTAYNVEDIPMTGRVPFFPGVEINLETKMEVYLTEENRNLYFAILNGESVKHEIKGQYTIETAWQLIEKAFESSL